MCLRRTTPFCRVVLPLHGRYGCQAATVGASPLLQQSNRDQSSSSSSSTPSAPPQQPSAPPSSAEAIADAMEGREFSQLRGSLLQGAESASIYQAPSAAATAASAAASAGFEDPAQAGSRNTRLFLESVVDTDPIGGAHRSDYYRDPSAGYAPTHAPRNFGAGGSVDAYHPLSSLHYEMSHQQRSDDDHYFQSTAAGASSTRSALLHSQGHLTPHQGGGGGDGGSPSSSASVAAQHQGQEVFGRSFRQANDTAPDAFFQSAVSPRTARGAVGSWNDRGREGSSSSSLSWVDASSAADRADDTALTQRREAELEFFRELHGERDRERHEESRAELYALRNPGYDVDRINAMRQNPAAMRRGISPLIPPGSAAEAQSELRKNSVSDAHAIWREQAASNTSAAAPLMGEALTDHLVEASDVHRSAAKREAIADWHRVTGRGRTNALVADAGPDQRPQKLGKNDERLLNAGIYSRDAYRNSDDENRQSPYDKRKTDQGVGHLLHSEFDRRRRADLLAHGKQDPIERSHMHLGMPTKEQIDEKVRARLNIRGMRPIEYFHPFPKPSDMLLLEAHSDVEGFPLFQGRGFNTRLAPFEWDLFIRYRAHAAQRRALALKHGLEPRPNESIQERNARRAALDELCESTPFDPSFIQLDHGVSVAPIGELRQWFGAYWIPSPTLCNLMLNKQVDLGVHLVEEKRAGLGDGSNNNLSTHDDREHVLSVRYLNKLLTIDAYNNRLQRNSIKEQFLGRAPEPQIEHRVSEATLRHFTPEQRAAYDEYIKRETDRHIEKWSGILAGRRFLPQYNSFARLMKSYLNDVTTLVNTVTGDKMIASTALVQQEVAKAEKQQQQQQSSPSSSSSSTNSNSKFVVLDGVRYSVEPDSSRVEQFVSVKSDTGSVYEMLMSEWNALPEEHSPTANGTVDVNAHINSASQAPSVSGGNRPPYNRNNYIETQDVLWENRVATGEEGWTTALHTDGLKPAMPIRARRVYGHNGDRRYGDYERAMIEEYQSLPFYNPDPREVTVKFAQTNGSNTFSNSNNNGGVDSSVSSVPLSNVLIWQAQWSGQERTVPMRTYRLSMGMKRYVNFQDPKGKVTEDPHFLDRYLTSKQRAAMSAKWRTSKSIGDMDQFTQFDYNRPHNHRLISGSGVKNYFRGGFLHRFTPWEFILTQEADQPLIAEQLRSDSTGPSFYFSPNRFWRHKRRPYGFIKNHDAEVRDLFQYIDAITPWEKAKLIRTQWEVRDHHPMPSYMRPGLGVHRNTPALLPTSLWESDKKTGKVKVLKDSIKDYKPLHVHPPWTRM